MAGCGLEISCKFLRSFAGFLPNPDAVHNTPFPPPPAAPPATSDSTCASEFHGAHDPNLRRCAPADSTLCQLPCRFCPRPVRPECLHHHSQAGVAHFSQLQNLLQQQFIVIVFAPLEFLRPQLTVCPLGQPNKAIGLESQIEPWLANCPHCLQAHRCPTEERNSKPPVEEEKLTTPWHRVTQRQTGAGCQNKTSPSKKIGEVFSLDIPFYRTRPNNTLCEPARPMSAQGGLTWVRPGLCCLWQSRRKTEVGRHAGTTQTPETCIRAGNWRTSTTGGEQIHPQYEGLDQRRLRICTIACRVSQSTNDASTNEFNLRRPT